MRVIVISDVPPEKPRKMWEFVTKTKYRTYYRATNNIPAATLFSLIVLLGSFALGVAIVHFRARHELVHDDRVLGGVGIFLITLGIWRGYRALRNTT